MTVQLHTSFWHAFQKDFHTIHKSVINSLLGYLIDLLCLFPKNSLELWDDFTQGLDVLEEHKRSFLKTLEFGAFSHKDCKALWAVFLIFFKDWKLAYFIAIKWPCLDFCLPLYHRYSWVSFYSPISFRKLSLLRNWSGVS